MMDGVDKIFIIKRACFYLLYETTIHKHEHKVKSMRHLRVVM